MEKYFHGIEYVEICKPCGSLNQEVCIRCNRTDSQEKQSFELMEKILNDEHEVWNHNTDSQMCGDGYMRAFCCLTFQKEFCWIVREMVCD